MNQLITTKRPKLTPEGYVRFKYCTGGYKKSMIGSTVENDQPVWAERRTNRNAIFSDDRVYYRLYTFIKI